MSPKSISFVISFDERDTHGPVMDAAECRAWEHGFGHGPQPARILGEGEEAAAHTMRRCVFGTEHSPRLMPCLTREPC